MLHTKYYLVFAEGHKGEYDLNNHFQDGKETAIFEVDGDLSTKDAISRCLEEIASGICGKSTQFLQAASRSAHYWGYLENYWAKDTIKEKGCGCIKNHWSCGKKKISRGDIVGCDGYLLGGSAQIPALCLHLITSTKEE